MKSKSITHMENAHLTETHDQTKLSEKKTSEIASTDANRHGPTGTCSSVAAASSSFAAACDYFQSCGELRSIIETRQSDQTTQHPRRRSLKTNTDRIDLASGGKGGGAGRAQPQSPAEPRGRRAGERERRRRRDGSDGERRALKLN